MPGAGAVHTAFVQSSVPRQSGPFAASQAWPADGFATHFIVVALQLAKLMHAIVSLHAASTPTARVHVVEVASQ